MMTTHSKPIIISLVLLLYTSVLNASIKEVGPLTQMRAIMYNHSAINPFNLQLYANPADGSAYGFFDKSNVSLYIINYIQTPGRTFSTYLTEFINHSTYFELKNLCVFHYIIDEKNQVTLLDPVSITNTGVKCIKSNEKPYDIFIENADEN